MLAQNGCKIRMRTALMHKNGFAYSGREFKLTMKSLALYLRGRKIAVVVETALADGDDFRAGRKRRNLRGHLRRPFLGVVRMHARGGK